MRFVRKRDPRVKKRAEEMKILNEAQKQKNESKRLEVLRFVDENDDVIM